jgi:hypothetical protein
MCHEKQHTIIDEIIHNIILLLTLQSRLVIKKIKKKIFIFA